MKNYPRIKRLSTIGIVHHQEFDYEFNAFRTDFVGEGGAGKSMISDLLQLIFVGTAVFHSPTKSTGERKPHTMVLKTEGKGTDMGYAFLNIEVAKELYLVVGIYLESSGQSNVFIIQSGHQFTEEIKLISFPSLLGCNDFISNGSILPLQQLKEHIFDSKGLTCESWQHMVEYHKILYSNYILPIDLSKSRKTLENYAKIIQAFSREALDISKSDRLKNFLFGDEKEREFVNSFEKAIEELSGDVRQFEINSEEIEKLTHKQEKLQDLMKSKQIRDDNQHKLINAKYNNCTSQITLNESNLIKFLSEIKDAEVKLKLLKSTTGNKISELKQELISIETEHNEAFKEKVLHEEKSDKVSKFFSWLKHFNCRTNELMIRYQNYHKSKDSIEKIKELQDLFNNKKILKFVETLDLPEKNTVSAITDKIAEFKNELSVKESLKALKNIDNQNSLAYWAINLGRKLSLEEESIIHKFHNENILVQPPVDTETKYVPEPQQLLNNIASATKTADGLWLNFNGLFEFIPFVKEQIFDTDDVTSIKKYFEEQTRSLDSDISKLKGTMTNYQSLLEILNDVEIPENHIKAWNLRHQMVDSLETHEMYDMPNALFIEYSGLMVDNNKIAEDTKNAKASYKNIDSKKTQLNTVLFNLERTFESLTNPTIPEDTLKLYAERNLSESELNEAIYLYDLKEAEEYFDTLTKMLEIEKKKFNSDLVIRETNKSLLLLNEDKKRMELLYSEIINNPKSSEKNQSDISTLEQFNAQYQNDYKVKYNVLVNEFLKDQAKRFEDTGDFPSLCSAILPPEIFNHGEMLDENIIENINKHLRDINLRNQNLNGRKLQKLCNIIDQVDKEVSEQLNDIRRIKGFFNEDGMVITGGNHVYLETIYDNVFPREWMSKFTQQINSDFSTVDEALFTPSSIASELERFPSLAEKMRAAFYKCGGSNSLRPKPEDLLNPKSYYDLKFSIKSMHGKKNDGSTSQTYAAISLLCMARLGLLDRTQPKDKIRDGIRFMAIDEAEGLGSNFNMLFNIAKENDYQILSLSINPNKVDAQNQNIYLLMNSDENEDINYEPIPIFGSANNN